MRLIIMLWVIVAVYLPIGWVAVDLSESSDGWTVRVSDVIAQVLAAPIPFVVFRRLVAGEQDWARMRSEGSGEAEAAAMGPA